MNDFEEIKKIMEKRSGNNWESLAKKYSDDREIILKCVSHDGLLLGYASDRLRNDKEVVMVATSKEFNAFFYASFDLKNDIDVIRTAYHATDFEDAKFFLQTHKDKEFVIEFLRYFAKQNPANSVEFLRACPLKLKCDEDILAVIPVKFRGEALRRCFKYSSGERLLNSYLNGTITIDCIDEKYWQSNLFCKAFKQTAWDRALKNADFKLFAVEYEKRLNECVERKHEEALKTAEPKVQEMVFLGL